MNLHFQQSTRLGRLTTALGADELALLRLSGVEYVNTLYEYRVEALSVTDDIDFDALIGTHATVEIDHPDHGPQPFDGIVTRARFVGAGSGGYRYEFDLRPWLWLTGKRRNQQIFHRMSVVEILHDLWEPYADLGAPALEMYLSRDYPELEYTVQFQESDLDFACRLMERFGISYAFRHAPGSHTLVLVDSAGPLDNVPGGERPYYSAGAQLNTETEQFSEWRTERSMTTGAVRLTDYNFKTPGAKMITERRGDAKHAEAFIEAYDWPGRYPDLGRGEEAEIGLRLDQERGQDRRTFASGNCLCLRAGHKVALSGDPLHAATGNTFICLSACHDYTSNAYGTGGGETGGNEYTGSYTLMPVTAPLAPRRKTPLAIVQGPHTATVVGDGEIDCDEYGRILVRFHWDLDHAYSMRCRVSQSWAGGGWGGMVIPRNGMEVVVEFLDGDPDKPLVTGCVYNGRNDAPYPLPEHKTKSVFRSDSHESAGFNELSFEDARGQENIALHAQKDQTLKVLNNRMKRVDNDQVESVGSNKSIEVSKNHQEKIGGSMNLIIGGGGSGVLGLAAAVGGLLGNGASEMASNASETGNSTLMALSGALAASTLGAEAVSAGPITSFARAGRNQQIAGADQIATGTGLGQVVGKVMPVSGIMNTVVEKAKSDTIGLARTEQIGLLKNTVVGQIQSTTVGKRQTTKIGEIQETSVGKNKTTVVGEQYLIEVGKAQLVLKSDGSVTLTGKTFHFEATDGIKINGKTVKIN